MIAFLYNQRSPAQDTEPSPTVADALAQAIHQIQTWDDLAMVEKMVRAAYQAGQLTQEQVESLAALAAQEGHCLPEMVGKPLGRHGEGGEP